MLLYIWVYKKKVKPLLSLNSLWEIERGYITCKVINITKRFMQFESNFSFFLFFNFLNLWKITCHLCLMF